MKKTFLSAVLLTVATTAWAQQAPSTASLERLFDLTQSQKLIDTIINQVDTAMHRGAQQAAARDKLTPADQALLDKQLEKTMADLREQISWKKLEPVYLKVYGETFTQTEVDGMVAFYQSPAGQAVITKLPTVMQKTMQQMQPQMMQLVQKAQTDLQSFVNQLSASHAQKPG